MYKKKEKSIFKKRKYNTFDALCLKLWFFFILGNKVVQGSI